MCVGGIHIIIIIIIILDVASGPELVFLAREVLQERLQGFQVPPP